MKKKCFKRMAALVASILMLAGSVLPANAAYPFEVKGDVKPSKTDYNIELDHYYNGMISNKTPVEMKEGKYYYMVYTVEKVEENNLWQNGIVATQDPSQFYGAGTMQYEFTTDKLLEPGCTYFYRFEMTKEGLSYIIAKADKNGELSYLDLSIQENNVYDGCKYFGLWLGGNAQSFTGSLSQVLCYDSDGNDLGVVVNKATGSGTVMNYDLYKEKEMPHSYEFSLKDAQSVAISNERGTTAETIFMSYTVRNVATQIVDMNISGGILSTGPQRPDPHGEGIINYEWCKERGTSLLHEGSHYLVRFDRNGGELLVTVKETDSKGNLSYYGFPVYWGTYRPESEYFSIFFGLESMSADFYDFKCYDEKGKNLAVQINKDDVSIRHIGNWEDYSLCKGVYYSTEKDTLLILDDENNIGRQANRSKDAAVWGSYVINDTTLTMNVDGKEETFDYLYDFMTDKDGEKYIRLKDQKVTFVIGDKNKKENQIVDVNAKSGYKAVQPENPSVEGYTFKAWCLGDGTEYDFENIVTESITLYAKYTDGDGQEYLVVDGPVNQMPVSTIVTIVVGILLVAVTIAVCIWIGKKGKKKDENQA